MSLRELKKHSITEIVVMVTILNRMDILEGGKYLEEKDKHPEMKITGDEAIQYRKYDRERKKLIADAEDQNGS